MTGSGRVLAFHFTRSVDASRRARAAVVPLLTDRALDVTEGVLLAVSELVTNVVRHTASGEGSLRVHLEDEGVVIEVSDGDPHGVAIDAGPPPDDQPGGRGLYLVGQVASELSVVTSRTGKTIWAYIPDDHTAGGD
jgi:anti-sigma regulatory factor (Ser/Thr protein kinase)